MGTREGMERMQQAVRVLLQGLGEDVNREGLRDTPKRVAKALLDCTQGYRQETASTLGTALFHEPVVHLGGEGVVVVRDVDFASTSEETLLPFHGRCHVAYRPKGGTVLGLSKLARLTRQFAKRLQTQERLALEVAHALQQSLDCHGVAVVLQARHLCNNSQPVERTSACVSGVFAEPCSTHLQEVLLLLGLDDLPASSVLALDDSDGGAAAGAGGSHLVASAAAAAAAAAAACRRLAPAPGSATASTASVTDSPAVLPATPDASERDTTDGDSDDLVVEVACCDDMEGAVQQMLLELGEDPHRPGLAGAARRYVMSLLASTSGYQQQLPAPPHSHLKAARSCCAGGGGCRSSSGAKQQQAASAAEQQPQAQQQQQQGGVACTGGAAPGRPLGGEGGKRVVSVRLPFTSQCEHHMLPFYGNVLLAYLPAPPVPGAAGAAGCCSQEQLLPQASLEQLVGMFTQRLQVQERITHQLADAMQQLLPASPGVMVVCDAAHMCMVARGVENHSGSTMTLAVRGAFEARPDLRAGVLRTFREQQQQR